MIENTFIIFKPDALARGLVGKITQTFEDAQMTISEMKYIHFAEEKKLRQHYNKDDVWKNKVGGFVKADYEKMGLDAKDFYGTDETIKLGQIVIDQLINYLQAGPVITMILTGNNAVKVIRKLVGDVYDPAPGTIRATYSADTKDLAALEKRSIINLLHASGEVHEAKDEISLWFPDFNPEKNARGNRIGGCCGSC